MRCRWLGSMAYPEALVAQRDLREAVIHGAEEEFWLLEHPSVVTVGRREVGGLERVRAAGIELIHTERGGLATWHGPGQLVGYGIVDIGRRGIRVRDYVALLEQSCIDLLQGWGVAAERDPRGAGIWVQGEKIGSVGIHIRHGVTLHGFALNLCPDLAVFDLFDPCGLGARMTSAALHGFDGVPEGVADQVGKHVIQAVDTASRQDYARGAEGT